MKVNLFSSRVRPADLMFIGSHCPGVDVILKLMRRRDPRFLCKVINVGSSGGLAAIRRGEADIAGVHLLDERTGEYNVSSLEKYGIEDKAVLIGGYIRKQGLIVAKGNPKKIEGVEDLLRNDVTLINRNQGSGTRILLDTSLRAIAEKRGVSLNDLTSRIRGYYTEAKSHSSVAAAVAMGKADVGLGLKAAAEKYGLGFIPVADEHYDFAVNIERLDKKVVRNFVRTLRSEEFKQKLKSECPGLMPTEITGRVVHKPEGLSRNLLDAAE